jgi:hypothetical protein
MRRATSGASKIAVDYENVAPTQLPCTFGQALLAALALTIVDDWVGYRRAESTTARRAKCSGVILVNIILLVHIFLAQAARKWFGLHQELQHLLLVMDWNARRCQRALD